MGYVTVGWLVTIIAGILSVTLPRKWALMPILTVSLCLPPAEQFIVADLHFPFTRILLLFGFVRIFFDPQSWRERLGTIDKAMIAWIVAAIVTYTLLWQTPGAFVNRLGLAFDALGTYFLVKTLVWDVADIRRIVKMLAIISFVLAISMLVERVTSRNVLSVFGGVPLVTEIREGRLRCQGPFLHPIMAGSFGAALFPLALSLYWGSAKNRIWGIIGAISTTIIAITSSSSGPVFGYLAAIIGFCAWPLRRRMRAIRWGILVTLVTLHIVMKAPVWSLIGRVRIFSGSTSYHREVLIDLFMSHLSQWWLLGTKSTAGWTAWFLVPHDITNQFLRVGADGGVFTMILFITVIAFCFRELGRVRRTFDDAGVQRLSWALGVSLFVNVVCFLGCSYWDQVIVLWYTLLALVSRLSTLSPVRSASVATSRVMPARMTWEEGFPTPRSASLF